MESGLDTRLYLDGRVDSTLDWGAILERAGSHKKILWELDLGFFSALNHPLSHMRQLQTLSLAVEHFTETVYPRFSEITEGVILYQGGIFLEGFPWSEEEEKNYQNWLKSYGKSDAYSKSLYKIALFMEILDQMTTHLPEAVRPIVCFDVSQVQEPLFEAQLLSKEWFEQVVCRVEGGKLPHFASTGEEKYAVCLPDASRSWGPYRDAFTRLLNELQEPYRLIPEAFITTEWEGLDVIYYHRASLSPFGERKLQGFEAAGGKCLSIA